MIDKQQHYGIASIRRTFATLVAMLCVAASVSAQSVCLPAPRLLTTMPMGGQVGTEVEVAITGESIEDIEELLFSHPGIAATTKLAADGKPEPNRFIVTIAADCPTGIHEGEFCHDLVFRRRECLPSVSCPK